MTMHSNRMMKGLLHRGVILSFLTFSTVDSAAEPAKIFENNKTQILKSNASAYDGFIFTVGKIKSNAPSQNTGFSKAQLDALSKMSVFFESKVNWPENLPEALRNKIWAEYLKCHTFNVSAQQIEIVFRDVRGDNYTVVVAVPETKVFAKVPDFSMIRNTLLLSKNYRSGKIRLNICIELCNGNIPEDLLAEYGKKIASDYGFNAGQVVLGKNAATFLCREDSNIVQQPIHTLFQMLNKSPYDPEICFYIGKYLENDGLKYNAQLFWQRGAVAKSYSPDFAEKCKALLRQPATVREMAVLPEMLFISSAGNTSFDSDFLAFLNFYAGMLPVGLDESPMDQNYLLGQNAFSRNNLPEAYKFYVDSVSEKITFQACNMAGNAGRRIGRIYEATAMLLQATVARPQSVYPWVHLAWIYDMQKLNRQKQYCIEKIKTYKLDKWSSQQLDLLTKK